MTAQFPLAVDPDAPHRDPLTPQELYVRAGDRLPSLTMVIEDALGRPYDLTDLNVFMSLRAVYGDRDVPDQWTVVRQVQVISPDEGIVFYDWQDGDLDVEPGQWELTLIGRDPAGDLVTFPTAQPAYIIARPFVETLPQVLTTDDEILLTTDGRFVVVAPFTS